MTRPIITEKVLVLRDCWIADKVVIAGQVITVSRDTAARLVGVGAVSRKLPEIKEVEQVKEIVKKPKAKLK